MSLPTELYQQSTLFFCLLFCFHSDQECHLYVEAKTNQWPIVYSDDYNIGFMGLERLHPFDSGKWGKVFQYLKGRKRNPVLFICTDNHDLN